MLIEIKEQTKLDFEAACEKLGISKELPGVSHLREDHALNVTADYMLKVLIEAGKDGQVHDITNHDVRKYEVWAFADHGYEPGSGGSGFRLFDALYAYSVTHVGARHLFNSRKDAEDSFRKYPDLWEIVMLNVK